MCLSTGAAATFDVTSRTRCLLFSSLRGAKWAAPGTCSAIPAYALTRPVHLGFDFKPWTKAKSLADAADILEYLREAVAEYQLDPFIQYRQKVVSANW
ncbi:hypothetical protein ACPA9J_17960 [Pseudomonas aeruginosa]